MKNALSYFTLFFSTSTLLCCALPALLVAIGAGGVMASIYANVPGFTAFVQNKNLIFIIVAVLLLINGLFTLVKPKCNLPLRCKKSNDLHEIPKNNPYNLFYIFRYLFCRVLFLLLSGKIDLIIKLSLFPSADQ